MNELILATDNRGKLAELQALLTPIHVLAQGELGISSPDETGFSFIENAIIKARHASRIGQRPALADDSGLVVEALHGQPGIYSARFAGINASDAENIALLIDKLQGVPAEKRHAYFYCAIAIVQHSDDPTPLIATGRLSGMIINTPMGDNGFGYDPVMFLPEHGCTVAQLPAALKNTISHRANAFAQLADYKTRLCHGSITRYT